MLPGHETDGPRILKGELWLNWLIAVDLSWLADHTDCKKPNGRHAHGGREEIESKRGNPDSQQPLPVLMSIPSLMMASGLFFATASMSIPPSALPTIAGPWERKQRPANLEQKTIYGGVTFDKNTGKSFKYDKLSS